MDSLRKLAEEEGFEPPDDLHHRRFSNSKSDHAQSCTDLHLHESDTSPTKPAATSGTERHTDHDLDQATDHETTVTRPRISRTATALLDAIAEGRPESLGLAAELADGVLMQDLVKRATELRDLLAVRSPFALVRAVELAELLLTVVGRSTNSKAGG